jgi:hypothetical protein
MMWIAGRGEITTADRRRAKPVIERWQSALYARQSDYDWAKAFARLHDVFWKTRPRRPVVIFRGARDVAEIGTTTYRRWTSWTYDRDLGFKFTMPGTPEGPDVMAYVHPSDIEFTLPPFGEKIDQGFSEVVLRPGVYLVVKKPYYYGPNPPLSPQNYPEEPSSLCGCYAG